MSALTDYLIQYSEVTSPLMIIGLFLYIKARTQEIRDDLERMQDRINRLEDGYIPDGGSKDGSRK